MNGKYKFILLSVGIMLVLSIFFGASYAFYLFGISQEGHNVVVGDCFEVEFIEGDALNINNAIPISKEEGKQQQPFNFSVKNKCNNKMSYSVNIETMDENTIDLDAVRIKLDDNVSKNLGKIKNNSSDLIFNSGALSSKTVGSGTIEAGIKKDFNLRIWIDENSTYEQSVNKTFISKVVISTTSGPEAILASGVDFNAAMKQLAGVQLNESDQREYDDSSLVPYLDTDGDDDSPDLIPSCYDVNGNLTESCKMRIGKPRNKNELYSHYYENNITSVVLADYMPEYVQYKIVSDPSSDCEIYMWLEENIIKLYTDASKIYASDMSYMFSLMAGLRTLDLNFIDTSRTKDMSHLFSVDGHARRTSLERISIDEWDTSNVLDMSYMFYSLDHLVELDISNFDTSNVDNMDYMFYYATSIENLDLSSFDTSKVVSMSHMFHGTRSLQNLDLSAWNTSNLKIMYAMFEDTPGLINLDLRGFDTSNVEDMSWTFSYISNIENLDLSSFDTSNVTNMAGMFYGSNNLKSLDISNFNTSNVTDMSYMFYRLSSLTSLDVSSFDTANVTNMSYMFAFEEKMENIDISNFDTSKVTNMSYMFANSYYSENILKTIFVGDNWNTDNVVNSDYMFNTDTHLVGGAGTLFNYSFINKEYARVDDPTNGKPGYFTLKTISGGGNL